MLKNKVIIVTGGSGLIGRCIVNDLRKKGAQVVNAEISVVTARMGAYRILVGKPERKRPLGRRTHRWIN